MHSPFKKTDKTTPAVRYDASTDAVDVTITPEILEEARQQLEEEGVVFHKHKKSTSKTPRK
jgi:DNA-binding transcriptional regulator YhcF (GntR family)